MTSLPYEIRGPISCGGFARIYWAHDQRNDRRVVVKGTSGGSSAPLEREYQTLKRLNHPNVVRAFERFEIGNQIYFAMEEIGSPSHPFDPAHCKKRYFDADVHQVFQQLIDVVDYLHGEGVAHYELSPGVNGRARSSRRSSFWPRQMMAKTDQGRRSPSSSEFFG